MYTRTQLLGLVGALYARSVYIFVFTVRLSDDQVRDLQIWRNVLIAALPLQVCCRVLLCIRVCCRVWHCVVV